MATASNINESNEFITCGVCLCRYDAETRKPKFLPCSHTICFECLRAIWQVGYVTCPFCRHTSLNSDIQIFPNNAYALHMLKLEEQKAVDQSLSATSSTVVNWCFTCGSVAKVHCTTLGHSFVHMTADTIKNLEAFVSLKDELQKIKNYGVDQLALAIEKHKEIENHFNHLTHSVKATMDEILELQDENNLHMTELVSMLEKGVSKHGDEVDSSFEAKDDYLLAELKSLVEDSNPDDTADTLKVKLSKTVDMCEEKLREATAMATEYENFKKLRINISLTDEVNCSIPTCPWLENGFQLLNSSGLDGLGGTGRSNRKDLTLISHLIFSLIRRHRNVPKPTMCQTETANSSTVPAQSTSAVLFELSVKNNTVPVTTQLGNLLTPPSPLRYRLSTNGASDIVPRSLLAPIVSLPQSMPVSSNFVFGQSIFIMKLCKGGTTLGEIHIHPVSSFPPSSSSFPEFVTSLGDYCFRTPKIFCNSISKAVADVFVMLPMAHGNFKPELPEFIQRTTTFSQSSSNKACQVGDVGITLVSSQAKTIITGWSFIFPLANFTNAKYTMHVKNLPATEIFGRVVHHQMLEPIIKWGSKSSADRVGYVISLESI